MTTHKDRTFLLTTFPHNMSTSKSEPLSLKSSVKSSLTALISSASKASKASTQRIGSALSSASLRKDSGEGGWFSGGGKKKEKPYTCLDTSPHRNTYRNYNSLSGYGASSYRSPPPVFGKTYYLGCSPYYKQSSDFLRGFGDNQQLCTINTYINSLRKNTMGLLNQSYNRSTGFGNCCEDYRSKVTSGPAFTSIALRRLESEPLGCRSPQVRFRPQSAEVGGYNQFSSSRGRGSISSVKGIPETDVKESCSCSCCQKRSGSVSAERKNRSAWTSTSRRGSKGEESKQRSNKQRGLMSDRQSDRGSMQAMKLSDRLKLSAQHAWDQESIQPASPGKMKRLSVTDRTNRETKGYSGKSQRKNSSPGMCDRSQRKNSSPGIYGSSQRNNSSPGMMWGSSQWETSSPQMCARSQRKTSSPGKWGTSQRKTSSPGMWNSSPFSQRKPQATRRQSNNRSPCGDFPTSCWGDKFTPIYSTALQMCYYCGQEGSVTSKRGGRSTNYRKSPRVLDRGDILSNRGSQRSDKSGVKKTPRKSPRKSPGKPRPYYPDVYKEPYEVKVKKSPSQKQLTIIEGNELDPLPVVTSKPLIPDPVCDKTEKKGKKKGKKKKKKTSPDKAKKTVQASRKPDLREKEWCRPDFSYSRKFQSLTATAPCAFCCKLYRHICVEKEYPFCPGATLGKGCTPVDPEELSGIQAVNMAAFKAKTQGL